MNSNKKYKTANKFEAYDLRRKEPAEPERIDIYRFFDMFRKNYKILILAVALSSLINVIINPATETTVYGAKATVYIPPYTTQQFGENSVVVSNNASQLSNAVGLIQTKVYQDKIAEKMGVNNISEAGSYQLIRKKDTDVIEFICQSSDSGKAAELCQSVLDTFNNETIQEASMTEAVVVNPVTEYSNVTATSTFRSLIAGALAGVFLYLIYCSYFFITDKKFRSKEEVQKTLDLPVISVIPDSKK